MTSRPHEFPQSRVSTHEGAGPDFPGSSGDRERGKFRPSDTPRLTTLAVVGDDGQPIIRTTDELLAEILLWQKGMVIAQIWNMEGLTFTFEELLDEASHI